ncbi:MAG TPA: hypothetical protein V6C71_11875, partial [Coleofasciculaceae cyanobacterium]
IGFDWSVLKDDAKLVPWHTASHIVTFNQTFFFSTFASLFFLFCPVQRADLHNKQAIAFWETERKNRSYLFEL